MPPVKPRSRSETGFGKSYTYCNSESRHGDNVLTPNDLYGYISGTA
jgi:hypothetical protein